MFGVAYVRARSVVGGDSVCKQNIKNWRKFEWADIEGALKMEIYAWGANSHGQLGIDRFSEFELPTKVENPPRDIAQIVCGAGHTIVVDSCGNLEACGWNNKGQLGIGTTDDSSKFVKVKCQEKYQRVSCGWDTSAGITKDGRLFVWGSNNQNKLGISSEVTKVITSPMELKLPSNEKCADIQFGLRHSVILTESKKIFLLGSLKHFKKVNHESILHNGVEFLLLNHNCGVSQISSGQNHVSFLDECNTIHGIGDNKFMQCLTVSPTHKVIKIASGWTHNAFLTENRELHLYGRNNYGQLGTGNRVALQEVFKCPIHPIDDFQLGAEHAIIKSNGRVLTWGWNEHGNCGNGSFEDV